MSGKPWLETMGHGTNARYTRHLREGTVPCDECKRAHVLYNKWRSEERKREAESE